MWSNLWNLQPTAAVQSHYIREIKNILNFFPSPSSCPDFVQRRSSLAFGFLGLFSYVCILADSMRFLKWIAVFLGAVWVKMKIRSSPFDPRVVPHLIYFFCGTQREMLSWMSNWILLCKKSRWWSVHHEALWKWSVWLSYVIFKIVWCRTIL